MFPHSLRERLAAVTLAVLGVIYLVPIVLSNRPYIDDFRQILDGEATWTGAGRPLSDLLIGFVNLGWPLTDLSPLPQILAVALLVYACFLLFRHLDSLPINPVVLAAAASLFLLNPFLLENNSYKGDSLPFATAMLLGLVAALPDARRPVASVAIGTGVIVLMLSLYQPALNVTIAATLLLTVAMAAEGRPPGAILGFIGRNVAKTAIGFLIYMLVIGRSFPANGYALAHSEPVSPNLEGLQTILANIERAARQVGGSFNGVQGSILATAFGLAVLACLVIAVRVLLHSGSIWPRLAIALAVLASPALMLLATLGLSAVLRSPVFVPRVYLAFGFLLVFVTYVPLRLLSEAFGRLGGPVGRGGRALQWLTGVPVLLCLTIAFAYGVAQQAQRDFDVDIARRIGVGLRAIGAPDTPRFIVDGNMPLAQNAEVVARKYPIVRFLVPRYLLGSWTWGAFMLRYHGVPVQYVTDADRALALEAAATTPVGYQDPLFALTSTPHGVVLRF